MQTRSIISIAVMILLILLMNPVTSLAQREPKNKIVDDRLKTRTPINDETKPRERPGEKQKIKEKNPPPPIKEKKTEPKMTLRPISPPQEYPISTPTINVVERPHLNPVKYAFKTEAVNRFKEGDYPGALAYFNHAIAYNPEDYELYFYRGMVELELEFFDDAKNDFNIYFEQIIDKPEKYFRRDY